MLIIIDDLNTEINRIRPQEELMEENERLVKICEKLHIKCDMLKKEIQLRDAKEVHKKQKF
jgi:hypothetical protein